MTPLPSEMWIILQSSKCSWLSKHFGPHLLDCNIIHISLDNGVMRTPKRCVTYLSFFFLVACFNKTLLIKSLFDWFLFILFYLNINDTFWIIFSGFQKIILLLSPRHYKLNNTITLFFYIETAMTTTALFWHGLKLSPLFSFPQRPLALITVKRKEQCSSNVSIGWGFCGIWYNQAPVIGLG